MKISVSLPDDVVEFLDQYVREQGYGSRSAVVHRAVRILQSADLAAAYADAWDEWSRSGDADLWEIAADDGVTSDAAR